MATVIFTMRDGTARSAEGASLRQADSAWWHMAQGREESTVELLGEGSDINDVADIEVRLTPEEEAINPRIHGVRQPLD